MASAEAGPISGKELREHVAALALESNLSVVFLEDDAESWDQAVAMLPYAPVLYSRESIEYQLAYQRGAGVQCEDCSLVLRHDNRPAGVWPLSVSRAAGEASVGSHGFPVLPPLFSREFADATRKTMVRALLALLGGLRRERGIAGWESAESFSGETRPGVSDWHRQLMSEGAAISVRHELFVDLGLDLAAIKSRFRKSYKSLITSGARQWKVHLMDAPDGGTWQQFRALHSEVAGRVTRSAQSWARQHEAIASGDAFLIVLRAEDDKLVGGGYFEITRDEGQYSVGAYDRSLFDKPIGHVVQFRAIEEMKRRGLRWYKIGRRPYATDVPGPSEKEISIGEFKEGFSTHLLPQFVYSLNVPR